MPRFFRPLSICITATAIGLSVGTLAPESIAQSRSPRDRATEQASPQQQLDEAIRKQIESILHPAGIEGEPLSGTQFTAALSAVESLHEIAAWYIDRSNAELFRDLARTTRLLRLMVDGRQTNNAELWAMFMEHEALADAIAFAIEPGRDSLPDAMLVLNSLRNQFGPERLAAFSNLTAAICAVHDQPPTPPGRRPTTAAGPNELWAYYASNENRMQFGVRNMPVDLLAHVVDVTASIEELQWAVQRYGRDQQVGNRYAEITYDDNAFQTGAPKRIDALPYTLQNIRQVGGVCTEQAYFAAHVGKAMGIPTVEVTSIGSAASHAWLGYLRVRGRQAAWDFDAGRYDEYKQYVGDFRDPLSGKNYDEGHVAFLSLMIGVSPEEIYRATAMHDTTRLFSKFAEHADGPVISFEIETTQPIAPVRKPDAAGISELLTAAFEQAGAERRVWELAGELASERRIAGRELEAVFTYLERLCGRNEIAYFAMMAPKLLWAIEDVRAQARLYDRVVNVVRQSPGHVAKVRFAQGDGLMNREMYEEAMRAYLLPTQSRNLDGPWTVDAIDRVTNLLRRTNKQQHLAGIIGDIFRKVPRPSTEGSHSARAGSVWGQVGQRYYMALIISGDTQEAQNIRRELDTILRRVNVPIR